MMLFAGEILDKCSVLHLALPLLQHYLPFYDQWTTIAGHWQTGPGLGQISLQRNYSVVTDANKGQFDLPVDGARKTKHGPRFAHNNATYFGCGIRRAQRERENGGLAPPYGKFIPAELPEV